MADLTGETPLEPDVVTCDCGAQWDRNIYSQCRECSTNLWDLDRSGRSASTSSSSSGPTNTVLEGLLPSTASIDVLVCGRRLSVIEGRPLRLGRQDEFETADAFREAMNVSREHAVLRLDDGRLHVTDTGSSNGTYVDGQKLPPNHAYEIRQGQELRLASNVPVKILWADR